MLPRFETVQEVPPRPAAPECTPVRNQPSLPSPKQDRSFVRLPRNGACDATAIMMDNLEEPARSRPTFVSAPPRYVTPLPPRNKTKNKQSKRAKIAESFDRHLLQGPANSVMPRKKKRAHERRARKSTLSPRFKVCRRNPKPAKKKEKKPNRFVGGNRTGRNRPPPFCP